MIDSRKYLLYKCLFISIILLSVYANTLNHGFVWDDTDIIVANPIIEKLSNIPRIFLTEDRIETTSGYYRPITYISFALERAVWGLNPIGFNITSLLLHIAAALLFYRVVAALFGNERLAFIAALLFSLHPIAGETVNFHSGGRNTLLCAVFFLAALLFHLKSKTAPAVLCFAVSIFSKEFGLLLPVILYAYDRFIKGHTRLRNYAAYLIPIVCYFTLRSYAVEKANLLSSLNFSNAFWNAPYLVIRYLANMVWPFDLKVLYDAGTSIYIAVSCLAASIALVAVMFYTFRNHRKLALSILWFLLFLLPVIDIIRLPAASLMSDRYAYFSLMGFSIALALLICRAKKQYIITLVLLLCTVYSVIDVKRNAYWKDDFSFYSRMIKDAPEMALGYHDLGIYYFKKDDQEKAAQYLALASSKPDVTARLLGAGAGAMWESERMDAAETLLLRQLKLDPANPQPYIMLKMIYQQKGDPARAKTYQDKAQALFPGIEQIMEQRTMGVTQQAESFMAERSYEKAANLLREALAINPGYVPALIDMASCYAETNEPKKSLKYLHKVVSVEPLNPSAHYNLSMLYQMQGQTAEAESEMKKYNEIKVLAKQGRSNAPR